MKHNNFHIIGVPEGEARQQGIENFPNLMKEKDTQVQEAYRVPNKINLTRLTPRHIIIKMQKFKEKILKTERKNQFITYKRAPTRMVPDFSKKHVRP